VIRIFFIVSPFVRRARSYFLGSAGKWAGACQEGDGKNVGKNVFHGNFLAGKEFFQSDSMDFHVC